LYLKSSKFQKSILNYPTLSTHLYYPNQIIVSLDLKVSEFVGTLVYLLLQRVLLEYIVYFVLAKISVIEIAFYESKLLLLLIIYKLN
jgi:hypothetical protein